eukprot:SAG11_NODE_16904_length_534_cov_0.429885_1_plen_66_part_01
MLEDAGEMTVPKETGKELPEDAYGFAKSAGGYKAFQRATGAANLMDQLDDARAEVAALQSALDAVA